MNLLPPKLQDAPTQLEHMCRLHFNEGPERRRLSGICATIGTSCRNVDMIYQMIEAGMTIARINFSHEEHEQHMLTLECLQKAIARYSKEQGYNHHVAIAADFKGREIRTGLLENLAPIELKRGDLLRLSINRDMANKGTKELVYVDYPAIISNVEVGQRVCIDDNAIALDVREVSVDCLVCQVVHGGILGNKKCVVMPGVPLELPVFSEKDAYDLKFSIDNSVDFIFLSKMHSLADIEEVRQKLGGRGKHIKIITKVESVKALQNLEEIMSASDGIIVARADLGIELKPGKVFLAQKAVIARCNKVGKPVICGTQLLMSMCTRAVPLRSDIADIGNALLDGADCLMLSSETAIGLYPVEAVKTLEYTCREAEAAIWHRKLLDDLIAHNPAAVDAAHAVAISAVTAARNALATAIIVLTVSGKSAQLISTYRPPCPIFAVTRCNRVARQANICRGIIPVQVPAQKLNDYLRDIDARVNYAMTIAQRLGIVKTSDAVVVLSPWRDTPGFTNNIRVVYAYFEKDPVECLRKKQQNIVEKPMVRKFVAQ